MTPFRRRSRPPSDPDAEPDPSVWAPPPDEAGAAEALPEVLGAAEPEEAAVDVAPPDVAAGEPEPAAPERAVAAAPRLPEWAPVVTDAEGAVRAAGGVVWTCWGGGLRVVVVHRPRYDDWSLPKGKARPGESDTACALREVREETGLACSLGAELPSSTYLDRHGRTKTVRYWAMQPLGGKLQPQTEVDEVRWLAIDEAKRLLSYERDVDVLDALAALEGPAPE